MKIIINNINSQIITSDLSPFYKLLSVEVENKWFIPSVRLKRWDGITHFLSKTTGKFPTGLLHIITDYCKANNIDYKIKYRNHEDESITELDDKILNLSNIKLEGVDLRPYQINAIKKALTLRRGILHLATNAGKTEVSCAMIKILQCKTLFLVHTRTLLYQTKARIEKRLGIDCGIIGDGEYIERDITVGMVQSIYRKLNNIEIKNMLAKTQLFFADEVQHFQSRMFYNILKKCPAYFRYGLSGTPFDGKKTNDWKVMAMTGKVIDTVNNDYLIRKGYSAKPIIYIIKYDCSFIDSKTNNYQKAHLNGIVKNDIRNNIISYLTSKIKGNTLILVNHIKHGKELNNSMQNAIFICGNTEGKERERIIKETNKSNNTILIATTIFDEGVDIPSIKNLILAGGGLSQRKVLQRVGRVLRKTKDNDCVRVFDFFDKHNDFLKKHSLKRIQYYKKEHFEIRVKGVNLSLNKKIVLI